MLEIFYTLIFLFFKHTNNTLLKKFYCFFFFQGSKNWLIVSVHLNTTEVSLRVRRRVKGSTKACVAVKTMCYKDEIHPLLEEKFSDQQCINTGLFLLTKRKNIYGVEILQLKE